MPHRSITFLAAIFLAACSSTTSTGTTGAGGSSTSSATTGSGGAGGSSTSSTTTGAGGSNAVQCNGNPPSFPTFDSSCQIDPDCVLKFHQIICCGTRVAIGVAVSASAAFDAAEATCEAMYPACGCAQQPTKADDGKTTSDESQIMVGCKMGGCSTFIP